MLMAIGNGGGRMAEQLNHSLYFQVLANATFLLIEH